MVHTAGNSTQREGEDVTVSSHRIQGLLAFCALGMLGAGTAAAAPAPAYHPIDPTLTATTIVLTGHDLSFDALMQIARHGAKVRLSAEARQQQADNYGMLLEAQAEGVPIYILNRGGGLGRANVVLEGDALSADNKNRLEQRELAAFEQGALEGDGPEIADEELVRAVMAIRANSMVFETPSPQLSQMLLDLLNADITPVMQSRGTVGESDLYMLGNLCGAMVGRGEAYLHGVRMGAADALRRAGLATLKPFALDSSTLANSNGYSTALAALLVVEGKQALDWADLTDAIDLNGMNGSITPLSLPVQMKRPSPWLNWDAARLLDMLKGSYLFDDDPQRILADADSLRASSIRQGAAWQAWAALRDAVMLQINSSDHNPLVNVGLSPKDSWELATPQMMKYYVKGGKYSNGKHGYVVSSANWDPYPMANDIEAFTNALANVGVVVTQRMLRFSNPFFTVLDPTKQTPAIQAPRASATLAMSLWQELQLLAPPVPAEGVSTDSQGNGDIESQAALKASRGRQAVEVLLHLLGQDLLNGAYWLDARRIESPGRQFGSAATLALAAFRQALPGGDSPGAQAPRAYEFIKTTPIDRFYSATVPALPPLQPKSAR
jgi:histidine ammonia-lyase